MRAACLVANCRRRRNELVTSTVEARQSGYGLGGPEIRMFLKIINLKKNTYKKDQNTTVDSCILTSDRQTTNHNATSECFCEMCSKSDVVLVACGAVYRNTDGQGDDPPFQALSCSYPKPYPHLSSQLARPAISNYTSTCSPVLPRSQPPRSPRLVTRSTPSVRLFAVPVMSQLQPRPASSCALHPVVRVMLTSQSLPP